VIKPRLKNEGVENARGKQKMMKIIYFFAQISIIPKYLMYPKYLSNTSDKHLALTTTRTVDHHLLFQLPCDQVRTHAEY
jgi:hypothetical protein